jgi:hypothetical protein
MFSAIKYRRSVGAMDMMGLPCGMQAAHRCEVPTNFQELLVRLPKLPNAMMQINGSAMLIELYRPGHRRRHLSDMFGRLKRPGRSGKTGRELYEPAGRMSAKPNGRQAMADFKKTGSRRSLRNPIRCFDQAAMSAATPMADKRGRGSIVHFVPAVMPRHPRLHCSFMRRVQRAYRFHCEAPQNRWAW